MRTNTRTRRFHILTLHIFLSQAKRRMIVHGTKIKIEGSQLERERIFVRTRPLTGVYSRSKSVKSCYASRPPRTNERKKSQSPKVPKSKRFEPRGEEKIRSERARSNWLELLPHRPIHSSPTKAIHSCEISENEPVTRRVYGPIRLLILYTLCMLDAAMGESICFASASFHHELFFSLPLLSPSRSVSLLWFLAHRPREMGEVE